MRGKRILQHVVQAVFQIDNVRICVKLMNAALNEQPPLLFRIRNLGHLRFAGDHFVTGYALCLHLRHFPVYAAFIAVMLFRGVKDLLILRQMIRQYAWKETQTAHFRRFVPERQRGIHPVHPRLQPGLVFTAHHAVFA